MSPQIDYKLLWHWDHLDTGEAEENNKYLTGYAPGGSHFKSGFLPCLSLGSYFILTHARLCGKLFLSLAITSPVPKGTVQHRGCRQGLWNQEVVGSNPSSAVPGCMTLSTFFIFLWNLQKRMIILSWELNKLTYVKHNTEPISRGKFNELQPLRPHSNMNANKNSKTHWKTVKKTA